MLSKADEYPIHQLPEPIAYPISDPNFYDRYFFNGYSLKEEAFFAVALGVYPNLNIVDAAFSVISNGTQHNLRTSRHMGMERMDTIVGPIEVDVLEPLKSLRIVVHENDYGISGDLTFNARTTPLKEPRYTHRLGPRVIIDCTRMTQNGSYTGWINVKGDNIALMSDTWLGTRDRSWGIHPVGAQDPQPPAPATTLWPQFYWLWAPANFDDCITLFDVNEDQEGNKWHSQGLIAPLGEGAPEIMKKCYSQIKFKPGTRHAESAMITFVTSEDKEIQLHVEPLYQFYMSGIGYTHPEWGHGMNKGPLAVTYDSTNLANVDETDPLYMLIQSVSDFKMGEKTGKGVLEQAIIGPHAPSGFKDMLDMAP